MVVIVFSRLRYLYFFCIGIQKNCICVVFCMLYWYKNSNKKKQNYVGDVTKYNWWQTLIWNEGLINSGSANIKNFNFGNIVSFGFIKVKLKEATLLNRVGHTG